MILSRLRNAYWETAAKNTRFYHALSDLISILNEVGIPVILLKGAHLAEGIYKNVGMRPMCDVDLLVRKEELRRLQEQLIQWGDSNGASPLKVDIHWNIDLSDAPLCINLDGIWARTEPAIIAGAEVLVLCPEDLLLHLCTHFCFHHTLEFGALRTLCDIREVITHFHDRLEWEALWARALEWRAVKGVHLTLLLCRDLLDADVPAELLERLKPDDPDPQVEKWAIEQIFSERQRKDLLSIHFWKLWGTGSLHEKARNLLKLLFPPRKFVSQKYATVYGSAKNYLYYLVRLKDHLSSYGDAIWRMVLRDENMRLVAERERRNIAMREWLSMG